MRIKLNQISKRFKNEKVLQNLTFEFESNNIYVITGSNGSGKSTLLQLISGKISPTEGNVLMYDDMYKLVELNAYYKNISYAAPYIELIEELTVNEMINFHFKFKKKHISLNAETIAEFGLQPHLAKYISDLSSGLKQRIKLMLILYSDTKILLLDEPCSNLDAAGRALYKNKLQNLIADKLVLIASNDVEEYNFFEHTLLSMLDFKK